MKNFVLNYSIKCIKFERIKGAGLRWGFCQGQSHHPGLDGGPSRIPN